MKLDDRVRLTHMLEASRDAISFSGSMTEDELSENRMVLQAIVRSIEIIGEAASQVSQAYRAKHPEIPWKDIVGMRNRLIHAYFEIDPELVYSTVQHDLPILVGQLEKLSPE
ncbi:MAG: DUF86 domain-containing protein [Chitinivibrionales bacterium]|nr:DUF86 domain-containing protein [Chitinivibrionales bacterium]